MASLQELLYGAPSTPVTQINPEMVMNQQMPQGFDPAQLQQVEAQAAAPQTPMADVVAPQAPGGKGSWDDPNRWLITAAALASGQRGLQMLPLAHMAYSELTGSQARESEVVQREQQRRDQETGSLVESRGAQAAQTRQQTRKASRTEDAEVRKANAEADLKQAEADVAAALDAQDPGAVKRAQQKLDSLRLANEGKEADIKQSKASAASSYASAAATGAVAKARDTLMNPEATQEMKDAALTVVHGRSQTAEQKDKAKWVEQRLKRANPNWTDAQLAQATLDYEGTRKGQELDALKYLAENTTDRVKKKGYEDEIEKLIRGPKGATSSPGTAPANADKGAWEKARNSVKPGEKYIGPDGQTYTRGK